MEEKRMPTIVVVLLTIVVTCLVGFGVWCEIKYFKGEENNNVEQPTNSSTTTPTIELNGNDVIETDKIGFPVVLSGNDKMLNTGGVENYVEDNYGNYIIKTKLITGIMLYELKIFDKNNNELFSEIVAGEINNYGLQNSEDTYNTKPRIVKGKLYYVTGDPKFEWECYTNLYLKYLDLNSNNLTPVTVNSFNGNAGCYK